MPAADYAPFRNACAIAGIGRTPLTRDSGVSELVLALDAAKMAIADAGMVPSDIDGIVRCAMDHNTIPAMAGGLALDDLGFAADIAVGGDAPCAMVGVAAAAILSGQARNVLVYRALNGRSEGRLGAAIAPRPEAGGHGSYDEFFTPYGLLTAPQSFALVARRHMIEYGTRPEHLGAVAVALREHACRTPHAQMHGKPLDIDQYMASRMIADPLRLFDCCLESDGAAALVMTRADRAKDGPNPPVLVRAHAHAPPRGMSGGMMFPSITWAEPLRLAPHNVAQQLWARAGLGPADIDVAQIYDCFTISVLLQLEGYGLCAEGESGAFVASGAIRADGGSIPCNTDGGNMSGGYVHGMNHIVEGVRQMRGTADVQVAGAETCLVTGGPMGISSALVLEKAA